jgi:hypothetical protein
MMSPTAFNVMPVSLFLAHLCALTSRRTVTMRAQSVVNSLAATAMHSSVIRRMDRRMIMKRNVFAMAIISIALPMFVPSLVRQQNQSRVRPVCLLLIILATMGSSVVQMVETMLERASQGRRATVMKGI